MCSLNGADGATASPSRTSTSPSAARRCSRAPSCRSARRARLPGRPQRLGQVDAAEDRRRPRRGRPRHALRAARRHHPLSAAGAGPHRLRDHAGLCRGRPRAGRRSAIARATCSKQLGLTGDEEPARLSGGEARRAALARVLAPEPDILLLDEPTNHLDLPAIEWLEGELTASRSALVLISHDRRFLERLSRATVWLDRGVTRRIERGFASFEEWRDQVLEEEEREHHKLGRKIVAEEHWLRYGVTARRKRNVRRLGELARPAPGAPRASRRARHGEDRRRRGASSPASSWSRRSGVSKCFGDAPIVATSRCASCAATASASSARTAPARPRCSSCSPASLRPTRARSRSAPTCRWRRSTSGARRSIRTRRCATRSPAGAATR